MTAIAVASAMRIRTAPPFVGRARRARLCSVWAGSGQMHSRPERRAERRRPFWLGAAGGGGGLGTALELLLGVVLNSRSRPARMRARRDLDQSGRSGLAICFRYAAGT